MAITVTCAECRASMEVPDSLMDQPCWCQQCGHIIALSAPGSKRCCICSVDVTRLKRTKDENGNYYCAACWIKKQQPNRHAEGSPDAALAARPSAPIEPADAVKAGAGPSVCAICRTNVPKGTALNFNGCLVCRNCATREKLGTLPYRIRKLRRAFHVLYNCPSCGGELESSAEEAGSPDRCPQCGIDFNVPGLYESFKSASQQGANRTAVERLPAKFAADAQTRSVKSDIWLITAVAAGAIAVIGAWLWPGPHRVPPRVPVARVVATSQAAQPPAATPLKSISRLAVPQNPTIPAAQLIQSKSPTTSASRRVVVEPHTAPIPGSVIDQSLYGRAIAGVNIWGSDEYETFRVGISGKLTGIALWAATQTQQPDTITVEIRPTRNNWPVETDSMALMRSTATVPAGTAELPARDYPRVIVRFPHPLNVHAGEKLAIVVLAQREVSAWLAEGNASSQTGIQGSIGNNQSVSSAGYGGRNIYFQTYVKPAPGFVLRTRNVERHSLTAAVTPHRATNVPRSTALAVPAIPTAFNEIPVPLISAAWQLLPPDVCDVNIAPDNRVWLTISGYDRMSVTLTPVLIKLIVQREFSRPQPQIFDLSPVLFGPGKWVWFGKAIAGVYSTLYGYDGKTWVRHKLTDGQLFCGAAPGHESVLHGSNFAVKGWAFFATQGGVVCFNGKAWTTKTFWPMSVSRDVPHLVLDPDGKGLVVPTPLNARRLWHWRNGHWNPVGLPPILGRRIIYRIAPITDHSAWVFTGDGQIVRINYLPPGSPGINAGKLLEQVAANGNKSAEKQLMAIGPSVCRLCERMARIAQQHGQQQEANRLDSLDNRVLPGRTYKPVSLGGYTASRLHLLRSLGNGRAIVAAVSIHSDNGATTEPGVLLLGRGARIIHPRASILDAFGSSLFMAGAAQVIPAGPDRVWLTRPGVRSATEINSQTGKIISVADVSMSFVLGSLPKGALFLSAGQNGLSGVFNYVSNAGRPRNVSSVGDGWKTTKIPPDDYLHCVMGADGRLWSYRAGTGVVYYNGRSWRIIPNSILRNKYGHAAPFAHIVVGSHGVLVYGVFRALTSGPQINHCVLVGRHGVIVAGSLHALVKSHRQELMKHFGPAAYQSLFCRKWDAFGNHADFTIWADKAGHIWCWEQGRHVWVYLHGAWHIVEGNKERRIPPAVFSGLGNGTRMFLGDQTGGWLVWLKGGNIHRQRIVSAQSFSYAVNATDQFVMNRAGDLWIFGGTKRGYHTVGRLVAPVGIVDETTGGRVVAVADSGTIWTETGWKRASRNFYLLQAWRNGNVVFTQQISGDGLRQAVIFSNRTGSVYAVTPQVTLHFVAAKLGQYHLVNSYCPLFHYSAGGRWSRLGFFCYKGRGNGYIEIPLGSR